jgi:hypothetical protein
VWSAECEAADDFAGDVAEHTLYTRGITGQADLCPLARLRAHRPTLHQNVARGGRHAADRYHHGVWIRGPNCWGA